MGLFFCPAGKYKRRVAGKMDFIELLVLAIGLSMDAFAISICKGLSVEKLEKKHMVITGLWFGGSQMAMPIIGYYVGGSFYEAIQSVDHWLSFALLLLIGVNMIRESMGKIEKLDASFSPKVMFPLAIADSIDALAVGVTFAFRQVPLIPSIPVIGATTFLFSAAGVWIGNRFGAKYKSNAELAGGLVLIGIGLVILLQDLGVL